MSGERIDDSHGVDARLRAALRDDVPHGVAGRLERRAATEVARRRSRATYADLLDGLFPAPLLSRLAIPAALVLLSSGALLQETVRPSAALEALSRVSVAASASRALGGASPLLCGTGSPLEGLGPEVLSRRAFRSWLLVDAESVVGGRMRLVFRAPEEAARYEIVVDAASFRPRTIRRTRPDAQGAAGGASDECSWPDGAVRGSEGRSR